MLGEAHPFGHPGVPVGGVPRGWARRLPVWQASVEPHAAPVPWPLSSAVVIRTLVGHAVGLSLVTTCLPSSPAHAQSVSDLGLQTGVGWRNPQCWIRSVRQSAGCAIRKGLAVVQQGGSSNDGLSSYQATGARGETVQWVLLGGAGCSSTILIRHGQNSWRRGTARCRQDGLIVYRTDEGQEVLRMAWGPI